MKKKHPQKGKARATKAQPAVSFDGLPELCTPEEGMHFLRLSRNGIYNLLASGALRHIRFGRVIRIPKAALLEGSK